MLQLLSRTSVVFLLLCSAMLSPRGQAGSGGLYFDGVNDHVTFGAATNINNLGVSNFTMECWFKWQGGGRRGTAGTSGITNGIPLVTKGMGENEAGRTNMNYFFGIVTNAAGQSILAADFEDCNTGLNHPVFGKGAVSTNAWVHGAVTYDVAGSNWVLYLNGVPDVTNIVTGPSGITNANMLLPRYDSLQHAALGSCLLTTGTTNSSSGFFMGTLDEVRIWNYARSAQQIAESTNIQFTTAPPGLIARWALDDSSGTTTTNSIGGGVNGTLTYGPVWTNGYFGPPTISISSPTNGSTVIGNWLAVAATASPGTAATVTNVEFYAGTLKIGECTAPPYVVNWCDVSPAGYSFTAVVRDSTGTSATSSVVNVTVSAPAASGSLVFDGINDYVTFGSAPSLGVTNFTIECWFKRTGAGKVAYTGTSGTYGIPLVTKGRSQAETPANLNCNFFFGISTNTGGLTADFEDKLNGGNHPITSASPVDSNTWQHAAVTYSASGTNGTWRLYTNGVLDTVLTLTNDNLMALTPESSCIQHGALASALDSNGSPTAQTPAGYFQGALDEVRIWNYARSDEEIAANYTLPVTNQDGLIARWALNEGAGLAARSAQCGGVTGDLMNGPVWSADGFDANVAPSVSITDPAGGATISGTTVTIEATASDPDGSVTNVQFLAGSMALGDDPSEPYSFAWSGVTPGAYGLKAVATDNLGLSATSAVVNVTIAPLPGVGGLYFDGTNDYVTCGTASTLGVTNFTIECWFKRTGTGTTIDTGNGGVIAEPLVTKGRGEGEGTVTNMNFFVGIGTSGVLVGDFEDTATGSNRPITGVTVITPNAWHHVSATYDGATWNLYLDGALDATLAVPGSPVPEYRSIQHAALGSALTTAGTPGGYFHGYLDEVRIWNYARSATEITNAMEQQIASAPGLIGRWGLNEAGGTVAYDAAGNWVNGMLRNGPIWVDGYPFPVPAGNTAPTVVLRSPVDGAAFVYPTNLTLNADAVDDVRVDRVEFVHGGTSIVVVSNLPFTTVWSPASMGVYDLTAIATDGAGLSTTSTVVNVTVKPGPPTVSITSPTNTATLPGPNVTIEVTANGTGGGVVTNVEFQADSVKLGDVAGEPFTLVWSGGALGAHALQAIATDDWGSRATSVVVNVTLTPPAGVGGLYFDGINDYVSFGPAPALGVTNFTIECWFKRLGSGAASDTGGGALVAVPLVTKGRGENEAGATNMNFFLGISTNGALGADFEDTVNGGNHPIAGVTLVQSNEWQHGAVTYDGTNWALYLNGVLDQTLAVTGNNVPEYRSIQHAALGSALNTAGTPAGYFCGVMDEVRVWDYARSGAEVANSRFSRITNATGLIARWALDEESGTVATNTGASAVDGALINNPVWVDGFPWVSAVPAITNQPQSRTNNIEWNAWFSVGASGWGTLSYQWLRFETNLSDVPGKIDGAQSPTLSVYNTTPDDAGEYSVIVANAAGSVTSAVAVLTINQLPVAGSANATGRENEALNIPLAVLRAAASDPDNDPVTVCAVGPLSTNGGSVSLGEEFVTYTPVTNFVGFDAFSFAVSDDRGGTNEDGMVYVTVEPAGGVTLNVAYGPVFEGDEFVVRFAGVPPFTYSIEWATNILGPWLWETNLSAPGVDAGFGTGVFEFRRAKNANEQDYYRTIYPPHAP